MPNKLRTISQEIENRKQKLVQLASLDESFAHLKGLSFWCKRFLDPNSKLAISDSALCCFNHWVGLPTRWEQKHPIYPFQEEIIAKLEFKKYLWILKAAKIGITELFLRYVIWKCISDHTWKQGQVAIIVGTNGTEADDMILRIKNILKNQDSTYKIPITGYDNRHEIFINSVHIKAHPADNIDAVRSKPNMKLILVDEMAFFRMVDQSVVRDAVEHYIGGSDAWIVLVSTAGKAPQGVMYEIGQDSNAVYEKITLDYTVGLQKHQESQTSIYKQENIDLLIGLPSFARNYQLSWVSGEGNIFPAEAIDQCITEYDLSMRSGLIYMALDPAYGTSKFGIVIATKKDGIIYILYAKEYDRPTPSFMISEVYRLYQEYHVHLCLCDGHYVGEIRDLKQGSSDNSRKPIHIEPMEFTDESKSIMQNTGYKTLIENRVRIHRIFRELIGQLKSAQQNRRGHVDKKITGFDLGDPFLMLMKRFTKTSIPFVKLEKF